MEIVQTPTVSDGIGKAKETLYQSVDGQTVLFLSGGKTPKELYQQLAVDQKLQVGAVSMVDERLDGSNEKMIRESGLLDYLSINKIPFFPINPNDASNYGKTVQKLLQEFSKRIAILGIGTDGHTAGIPVGFLSSDNLVASYDQIIGGVKGRISLTFKALEEMNQLILLVFGEDKKQAVRQMFCPGSESEIPARFYIRPEIAKKTLLISDQKV